MTNTAERRQGERRAGVDRRSGLDTRPPEERARQGERRSGESRRLGGERRSRREKSRLSGTALCIVLGLCALSLYDLRYRDGEHTLRPLQAMADKANYATESWLARAFGN